MELLRQASFIQAVGLTKQFGPETAVQDLTFDISHGTIFGFIGPSGCGKTTTVRLLAGVYEPSAGEITVLGKNPRKFSQSLRLQNSMLQRTLAISPELKRSILRVSSG
jgi:ABC-2 type transport system ATP-binding protein